MAITTHAVGSTYVRVALVADGDVAVQATGTAGLRVTRGVDATTPDPDAAALLVVYGNMATRQELPTGAIWVKSALQGRASEATVDIS